MFLSQLILNLRHREVQRALADVHRLHAVVMSAFGEAPPGLPARQHFRVLFRLDSPNGHPSLLVQSAVPPNWDNLPPNFLAAPPAVKDLSQFYNKIAHGAVLRFLLRANVTRRVGKHSHIKCVPGRPEYERALADERQNRDHYRGKRVEVWGEDRQLEWLRRKGRDHGFEVLAAELITADGGRRPYLLADAAPAGKEVGYKFRSADAGPGKRTRLSFGAVTFRGLLRVTDPQLFREALAQGVGPGKAFGFGLLSVAAPTG